MLRTKLSKFRQVCLLAFVPKIFRGDITRYSPGKFEKLSLCCQKKAHKCTNSNDNEENERIQQIIDRVFAPNIPYTEPLIKDLNPEAKGLLRAVSSKPPNDENSCQICERLIQQIFGDGGEINPKNANIIQPEEKLQEAETLQATTAKENEEKLTQKVEVIEETPLVEAHKPKVEGFNLQPKVLGAVTKDNVTLNFASKDVSDRSEGSVSKEETLDELAKRCLDSPSGQIDERILKEMEQLGVPPAAGRASRKNINENEFIQAEIMKKPRKPPAKTDLDLLAVEAKDFESDKYDIPPLGHTYHKSVKNSMIACRGKPAKLITKKSILKQNPDKSLLNVTYRNISSTKLGCMAATGISGDNIKSPDGTDSKQSHIKSDMKGINIIDHLSVSIEESVTKGDQQNYIKKSLCSQDGEIMKDNKNRDVIQNLIRSRIEHLVDDNVKSTKLLEDDTNIILNTNVPTGDMNKNLYETILKTAESKGDDPVVLYRETMRANDGDTIKVPKDLIHSKETTKTIDGENVKDTVVLCKETKQTNDGNTLNEAKHPMALSKEMKTIDADTAKDTTVLSKDTAYTIRGEKIKESAVLIKDTVQTSDDKAEDTMVLCKDAAQTNVGDAVNDPIVLSKDTTKTTSYKKFKDTVVLSKNIVQTSDHDKPKHTIILCKDTEKTGVGDKVNDPIVLSKETTQSTGDDKIKDTVILSAITTQISDGDKAKDTMVLSKRTTKPVHVNTAKEQIVLSKDTTTTIGADTNNASTVSCKETSQSTGESSKAEIFNKGSGNATDFSNKENLGAEFITRSGSEKMQDIFSEVKPERVTPSHILYKSEITVDDKNTLPSPGVVIREFIDLAAPPTTDQDPKGPTTSKKGKGVLYEVNPHGDTTQKQNENWQYSKAHLMKTEPIVYKSNIYKKYHEHIQNAQKPSANKSYFYGQYYKEPTPHKITDEQNTTGIKEIESSKQPLMSENVTFVKNINYGQNEQQSAPQQQPYVNQRMYNPQYAQHQQMTPNQSFNPSHGFNPNQNYTFNQYTNYMHSVQQPAVNQQYSPNPSNVYHQNQFYYAPFQNQPLQGQHTFAKQNFVYAQTKAQEMESQSNIPGAYPTPEQKTSMVKDPLSSSFVVSEPKAAEHIQNPFPSDRIASPIDPDAMSLSQLLKRVRERNRIEYCRQLEEHVRRAAAVEPVVDECGKKPPPCPPPAPKCPPPCPPPPKPKCPPPSPPCPNPCKPKCPPPCNPSPCAPKPPCPPPKKSPCDKFSCKFSPLSVQEALALLIYYGPQLHIPRKALFPIITTLLKNKYRKALDSSDGEEEERKSSNVMMVDSVEYARTYHPWAPIPSWPLPVNREKKKLQCPKHGCKQSPPRLYEPYNDVNPWINYPKPTSLSKRSFSLIDVLYLEMGKNS